MVELGPILAVDVDNKPKQGNYLIIEEIADIKPLDLQFGVYPRKTVPDSLYETLFGQPDPTEAEIAHYGSAAAVPPMRTYAILDAAKMPYILTGFIESSGLPAQSLFQGETAEKLKEHSPYLVELTEDNSFTARLLTGSKEINGLWEKELGVYVRSRAEFKEVRRHFRKFTKMQDMEGKWYYFMFWEPSMLVAAVRLIADNPIFEEKFPLYCKLLQPVIMISITGGRCFAMRSVYKNKETNLRLDISFSGFVYAITKTAMNEDKNMDFESIYHDIPRLWMLGIRNSEAVTHYAKIEKSDSLTFIADKIVSSELIRESSKIKAVKYLSSFAQLIFLIIVDMIFQ
ncbi:DUF4123 domain-containing protein [Thalassospira sp. TSL5-1]|uniref:DUF4123 domain-containing protein n=1 Tax=Thalassospira sp. TSL5-1 TaxID=1544451 RepID=UPI00093C07EC|nr:DUF4123 domain-containing protein [Thalassospira sp. TSL5-1]OKH87245.1 hypothetical protein LF95_10420 [Thalassospira sp. TSL5-1]